MIATERQKSALEKLRTERRIGGIAVLLIVLAGFGVMVLGLIVTIPVGQIANGDHLTDPSIPHDQMENATYTWTAKELIESAHTGTLLTMLGAGLALGGVMGSWAIPSTKRLHKIHCTGNSEWKYCPECGLKLSLLEDTG